MSPVEAAKHAECANLAATGLQDKPRLLFFQWDHSPNRGLSGHFLQHMNDHVKCLSEYFHVTVVNTDCDYSEMCDLYCPDLALFESGYQTFVSRRPNVRNARVNNGIPRVGFHNADSWSDCRSGFLSDMDRWGIETYFSICTTTSEYMPCVKDQMFIWPNFIDSQVFRDYRLEKIVPVMISGQHHEAYPWREKVFPYLGRMFPSLVCPTFHNGSGLSDRTLSGESYARALNASFFSPTCGTIAGEVVRKHLEIPGAKACLVTEESAALREAGFVHMENCVFAGPDDVVEAIDLLLSDRDHLFRITENGYRLIHSRHTARHRPQIYQWFMLQKGLSGADLIVQHGPFSDLRVESREASPTSRPFVSRGIFSSILNRADSDLWDGRLDDARQGFELCLRYVKYLPEARFGLALCELHRGNPEEAAAMLAGLIENSVVVYGAADPDPVEWVYFIICALARGDLERAREFDRWYPDLVHQERGYLQRAIGLLCGKDCGAARPPGPDRKSIHRVPERDTEAWMAWLAYILRRCGQADLAMRLTGAQGIRTEPSADRSGGARRVGSQAKILRVIDLALQVPGLSSVRPRVPPTSEFRYLHLVALSAKRRVTRWAVADYFRTKWRKRRARHETEWIRQRPQSNSASP
jgi:hypothetical protein